MKTAKKVLSVVLSALLILSTVIIAVSAYGEPTTERVDFSLKAEVFDAAAGAVEEAVNNGAEDEVKELKAANYRTENTGDVTPYKRLTSHTYQTGTAAEPIKVKAGQIVWVTVDISTSDTTYPWVIEQYVHYSTNMFLACCVKGTIATVTPADSVYQSYTKNWNPNYWAMMSQAMRDSISNCASFH